MNISTHKNSRRSEPVCFVVAPDGQAGGGMGRVKDYIIQYGGPRAQGMQFTPLVTRDKRGFSYSLFLTALAVLTIWRARLFGQLALVHVNFGDRASGVRKGVVVLATQLVGGRALLHLHAAELHHDYEKGGWLVKLLIRIPFRVASRVVVLGEGWRKWVIEDLGVRPDNVDILWNGVPVEPRRDRDLAKGNTTVQILFLGNLVERKGVSDLIAALKRLSGDLPDWHMTFAGGGDINRYKCAVASAGIADRVSFAGWIDPPEARHLLSQSDLLVLPSYDEGLPLVILEALGSATPVVCSPVGTIPEVLQDKETALFSQPGDPIALAQVLTDAISNRGLRASLSKAGLDLFEKRFSMDAFLASLFAIYRRGLGIDVVLVPKRGGHQ